MSLTSARWHILLARFMLLGRWAHVLTNLVLVWTEMVGKPACVGLRRRRARARARRRGFPNRDDGMPQGSGGRGKGRRRQRSGWRRRARRGRLSCGGSIRRESGGRREEHREEVPWCAHHAPTESLPHPSPLAQLKRKLLACVLTTRSLGMGFTPSQNSS
jgi:hypothetical protein